MFLPGFSGRNCAHSVLVGKIYTFLIALPSYKHRTTLKGSRVVLCGEVVWSGVVVRECVVFGDVVKW